MDEGAADGAGENLGEAVAAAEKKALAQLESLEARHSAELNAITARHRDELDYLRTKCDEKDRRLEVLTCERNTLRVECAAKSSSPADGGGSRRGKDKADVDLPDLEEGVDRSQHSDSS